MPVFSYNPMVVLSRGKRSPNMSVTPTPLLEMQPTATMNDLPHIKTTEDVPPTKKTKIAIVFSGQIRENGLGYTVPTDLSEDIKADYLHDILESYDKNFFTSEFKECVEYDIFISTDTIDIEKALTYFGKDKVKNIYLSDTNYYLHPIVSTLKSTDFYIKRLDKITDKNYDRYPRCIPQYHRMAQGFEMVKRYKPVRQYDYIIRSRLDYVYEVNLLNHIKELNANPACLYVGDDDHFGIGRPDIMKVYFNLIHNFGTYHDHHLRTNFKDSIIHIDTWRIHLIENARVWRYASLQLSESLYRYCDARNLDIDTTLKYRFAGYIRGHLLMRIGYNLAKKIR